MHALSAKIGNCHHFAKNYRMSTQNPPLPSKKDVALALLEGPSLFIHLDPRKEGVAVPQWFKNQSQLVLQVGLNMAVPIPDLDVDDEGITCTLSFNRSPHWCKLPWSAIYALVGEDGRAMVWPGEVPPELAAQFERATKKPALSAVPSEPESQKPRKSRPARKKRAPAKAKPKPAPALALAPPPPPEEPQPEATPAPAPLSSQPSGATKKKSGKKRELPPYLRVVK